MTRHTLLRRALLGTLAVGASAVLAACGGDMGGMDHGSGQNSTATASPGASFADADVTFAQNMIAHHEQAVQMSTLAEARAQDPELRALAAQVKAAQAPEIATMTAWLTSWGKPVVPPAGHNAHSMPGMMSDADMSALGAASGTDFDRMFARMMIAHHNGAIQMAQEESAKGSNPEAKQLATAIVKDQSAEVTKLQAILDRL